MAISEVSICNWALSRIAVSRTINDLNEAGQEAVTCKLFYEQCRDETLRSFAWPFATRFATLAMVDENNPAYDWVYSYRRPSNCLRVLMIRPQQGFNVVPSDDLGYYANPYLGPAHDPGDAFELAGDDQGRLILTNTPEARIVYIAGVTDSSRFDPDFASALAWKLASEIATPLAQSSAISQRAGQAFAMAIKEARDTAIAEKYRGKPPEAESIRERL